MDCFIFSVFKSYFFRLSDYSRCRARHGRASNDQICVTKIESEIGFTIRRYQRIDVFTKQRAEASLKIWIPRFAG